MTFGGDELFDWKRVEGRHLDDRWVLRPIPMRHYGSSYCRALRFDPAYRGIRIGLGAGQRVLSSALTDAPLVPSVEQKIDEMIHLDLTGNLDAFRP